MLPGCIMRPWGYGAGPGVAARGLRAAPPRAALRRARPDPRRPRVQRRRLRDTWPNVVFGLMLPPLGGLILTRLPRHLMGWIFLGCGLASALTLAVYPYAHQGLVHHDLPAHWRRPGSRSGSGAGPDPVGHAGGPAVPRRAAADAAVALAGRLRRGLGGAGPPRQRLPPRKLRTIRPRPIRWACPCPTPSSEP